MGPAKRGIFFKKISEHFLALPIYKVNLNYILFAMLYEYITHFCIHLLHIVLSSFSSPKQATNKNLENQTKAAHPKKRFYGMHSPNRNSTNCQPPIRGGRVSVPRSQMGALWEHEKGGLSLLIILDT